MLQVDVFAAIIRFVSEVGWGQTLPCRLDYMLKLSARPQKVSRGKRLILSGGLDFDVAVQALQMCGESLEYARSEHFVSNI